VSARLRLFPLNTVLFPGASLHLHVFEPRYKQMISECLDGGEEFGVCLIRDGAEAGDPDVDPYEIGTTAEIGDVMPLPFGRYYISTVGKRRFKVNAIVSREPYLLGEVEYLDELEGDDDSGEIETLNADIREEFAQYLHLLVECSGSKNAVDLPIDPVGASYAIGDALQVADSVKQRLLEAGDANHRLKIELDFLRRLLPQLRSLLERKKSAPSQEQRETAHATAPPGGETRSQQERYFGKFFSQN
jgi:Lon protease-like protein